MEQIVTAVLAVIIGFVILVLLRRVHSFLLKNSPLVAALLKYVIAPAIVGIFMGSILYFMTGQANIGAAAGAGFTVLWFFYTYDPR